MPSRTTPRTRALLAVRVLVVLIGTMAIWGVMAWLNENVLPGEPTLPVRFFNAAFVSGLAIPLVILARRFLDRRPWEGLGLEPLDRAVRPFLIGVAAFLVPSVLGVTVALLTGWVELEVRVSPAQLLGWVAVSIVLVFLFEALPEELIFRGYLHRNLSTGMAPWLAAVVQGVLFAFFGTALWVANEGWGVLVERGTMFLAMGVLLGFLRVQTGSIWTPIGFHLAFQVVAQTMLGERVRTDNEAGLLVAAVVSSFVVATTVTAFLERRDVNWSRPVPD